MNSAHELDIKDLCTSGGDQVDPEGKGGWEMKRFRFHCNCAMSESIASEKPHLPRICLLQSIVHSLPKLKRFETTFVDAFRFGPKGWANAS